MTRIRVLCDGCGGRMLVPPQLAEEVNYCRDCSPITEDYDPDLEEEDFTEDACD